MRLTVLGRYGPCPAAGGATSGYLIESGQTRLLLDCGSGVVSNLLRLCPVTALSGAVISHLHMDHASDLGVLRYALEAAGIRLPIVAPEAPADAAALLLDHAAYLWERSAAGTVHRIGGLTVRLFPARHPVPTFAARISDGARTLFYTGDSGDLPSLAEAAKGADVLLADACFSNEDAAVKPPVHLSPAQAARLARSAGAKHLLLTHVSGAAGAAAAMENVVAAGIDFTPALVVQDMGAYEV
jgi:ribonuclease BN (tRNA processing enzyme)